MRNYFIGIIFLENLLGAIEIKSLRTANASNIQEVHQNLKEERVHINEEKNQNKNNESTGRIHNQQLKPASNEENRKIHSTPLHKEDTKKEPKLTSSVNKVENQQHTQNSSLQHNQHSNINTKSSSQQSKNSTDTNIAINIVTPNNMPNNQGNGYYIGNNFNSYNTYYNDRLFWVRNIQCNQYNCQFPSMCTDATTCRCGEGRVNYKTSDIESTPGFCNYTQKKQIIAFLLELILQFGLGHLYAGRMAVGLTKLFLYIYFSCSRAIIAQKIENRENLDIPCHLLCACCALTVWYIVDAINFGTNSYLDGNSVPLQAW